jgi:hypothetical protein
MALEMVLNELSLQPAPSVVIARQWMAGFIETVRAAISYRISRVIRTQRGVRDIVLADGYPLRRWLNDPAVDLETRRYVTSLVSKAPLWDGLPELYDRVLEHEFRYEGREALCLGVAYLLEVLAVSLLSGECWDTPRLSLSVRWITEDENIKDETAYVIHASRSGHVNEHSQWIEDRLRSDIQDGNDLWNRRAELLPSLMFCETAGEQIRNLNAAMLRSVTRRLFELDAYCREWIEGRFEPDLLPTRATPESQATLEQYGNARTFLCPDDVERIFSWHVRLTPLAWRIHFYPDPATRTIVIGYVGPHLPTARHH